MNGNNLNQAQVMSRNEELLITMDTERSTEQRVSKGRTLSGKVNLVQVPNFATQHKGVWGSGNITAHIPNSTLDLRAQ